MEKNSGFATKQIHTGKIEIPGIAPLATPIFQTSTFEFETTAQGAHRFAGEEAGYIYTRLGNPNTTKIGEKLAALEHAEAGHGNGKRHGCGNNRYVERAPCGRPSACG